MCRHFAFERNVISKAVVEGPIVCFKSCTKTTTGTQTAAPEKAANLFKDGKKKCIAISFMFYMCLRVVTISHSLLSFFPLFFPCKLASDIFLEQILPFRNTWKSSEASRFLYILQFMGPAKDDVCKTL